MFLGGGGDVLQRHDGVEQRLSRRFPQFLKHVDGPVLMRQALQEVGLCSLHELCDFRRLLNVDPTDQLDHRSVNVFLIHSAFALGDSHHMDKIAYGVRNSIHRNVAPGC